MAAAIPHSFPLARRNVGVFGGVGLNAATMPFPLIRLGMGVLWGLATGLVLSGWLALVVVAYLYVHVAVSGVLMAGGALAFALLWLPFARRRTFRDQCAHTFILAWLVTRGSTGTPTFVADSRRFVTGALGDVEELDSLLNALAARSRTMLRRVDEMTGALPSLGKVTGWLTRKMLPYVQSLVIAYALLRHDPKREDDDGLRGAADDALVYVAQNARALVGACVRAVVSEKVLAGLVLLVFLALFGGAAWLVAARFTPELVAGIGQIPVERRDLAVLVANAVAVLAAGLPLAAIASWILREAFIRPALVAFVLARFLEAVQTQPLDERYRTVLDAGGEYLRTGRVRVPLP